MITIDHEDTKHRSLKTHSKHHEHVQLPIYRLILIRIYKILVQIAISSVIPDHRSPQRCVILAKPKSSGKRGNRVQAKSKQTEKFKK